MAYSYNNYTASGVAQILTVPPHIDRTHILVSVEGVSVAYTWLTAATISLTATAGSAIKVYRQSSPGARVTDYIDGVPLTEAALDNDSLQAFYLAQEQLDATADAVAAYGSVPQVLQLISAANASVATGVASAAASATAAAASETTANQTVDAITASMNSAAASYASASGSATTATNAATSATSSASASAGSAGLAANYAQLSLITDYGFLSGTPTVNDYGSL